MAEPFTFELVSPERLLVSEQVQQVVIPGEDGYFTVLAKHAPTMSTLRPGVAEVTMQSGSSSRYVVFGGFVDITENGCTLLAESAVEVSEIDAGSLDKRIQDATEDFEDAKDHAAKARAGAYLDQLKTLKEAVVSTA